MDHCSRITIGHNTKIVLQHNLPTSLLPCNTISQLPSLAIHYCILQYNFHVVCFPTILQYNVAIQFPPSLAIQSLATTQPRLQYNFCIATQPRLFLQYNSSYSSLLLYNTKILTTIFFQPSLLQYKTKACNTKSQYNLGNGPKPFLHFLSIIFFFKLLENHPKIIFILFFFLQYIQ